jgi:hypothetical protein
MFYDPTSGIWTQSNLPHAIVILRGSVRRGAMVDFRARDVSQEFVVTRRFAAYRRSGLGELPATDSGPAIANADFPALDVLIGALRTNLGA